MPINKQFMQALPYLSPDDTLTLHTSFWLRQSSEQLTVADSILGIEHTFSNTAVPLLERLTKGTTYRQLRQAAASSGISDQQFTECLGYLHTIGALTIQKTTVDLLRLVDYLRTRIFGISYRARISRHRSSVWKLALATLRATLPVTLACYILSAIAWSSGILQGFPFILCGSIGLFIASVYVHECAHFAALQAIGQPSVVMRKFLHLGIVHPKLRPTDEIFVAAVGPAAGVALCLMCGGICMALTATALVYVSAAIGCIHILGLLPWYGDGKSINQNYKALHERNCSDT